jgi:hypothetical protein
VGDGKWASGFKVHGCIGDVNICVSRLLGRLSYSEVDARLALQTLGDPALDRSVELAVAELAWSVAPATLDVVIVRGLG